MMPRPTEAGRKILARFLIIERTKGLVPLKNSLGVEYGRGLTLGANEVAAATKLVRDGHARMFGVRGDPQRFGQVTERFLIITPAGRSAMEKP